MKLACTSLVAVLLVCCGLVAQSPTTDIHSSSAAGHPAKTVVAGLVTKEPGSEAVKKALIELIAESQSDGGNYTAITGTAGSFRIENVAPGRYRLFVERTGYQEIDKHHRRTEGRVLTLAAGREEERPVSRAQAGG